MKNMSKRTREVLNERSALKFCLKPSVKIFDEFLYL